MMTLNKLFSALLPLFFTGAIHAAQASEQSIEDLLQLTKAESMVDSMNAGMEQLMRQQMGQLTQGKPIHAEQQRSQDAMLGKVMSLFREELNWAKLKPSYAQLYQETFDQEEIDGLIAFYRSPTGQAFVSKMPVVMEKSVALSQRQMQSFMPKMQAIFEEATAELKRKQ